MPVEFGGMESIQTDIAGLLELGAACNQYAAQVCAAGAAPPTGDSFQPSSAAVAAVHTGADAAEMLFASRLLSTGYTVVQAASLYAATDSANASDISSVVTTVEA